MPSARIGCSALLLAMSLFSPGFAAASEVSAKASVAPDVRMIARGNHRIAFHIIPGRGPTILLDAGAGEDSSHWTNLAPEMARRTGFTVISYDRAGYGASDEVKGPLNLQAAVDDLEHGLEALGATHKVILVSHSFAGEIATYITSRHPQWFAGAVLEDASIPDYFTDEAIAYSLKLYQPTLAQARAHPESRDSRGFLALADSWEETTRAFHKVTWPSAVPVVVIVSEETPVEPGAAAQWWRDAQAEFAKRAPNRILVTAKGSSHDVARDRPDTIIAGVEHIAAQSRRP